MIGTRHPPGRFRVRHAGPFCSLRTGFTLVELLVAVIIISILGSLSLAGLATARQRAKIDKTLSTIRKIDAVIRPMYDSYRTRRVLASTVSGVPNPSGSQCTRCTSGNDAAIAAWKQLVAKRRLMVEEMPDRWDDIYPPGSLPGDATAAARRYAAAKQALGSKPYAATYGDAELLSMITLLGGFEPDAGESFRSDEIGDVDKDSAMEFLDGWGRPIRFIRWPAAFTSPLISATTADPLDRGRVTTDWALVPVIVSGGPDAATYGPNDDTGGFGISLASKNWLGATLSATYGNLASTCTGNTMGTTTSAADSSDNISNHDLTRR